MPSLSSSYASSFISSYPSGSTNQKNKAVGVFFHKMDTGRMKDVLVVTTHNLVKLLLAKLSRGLRTTGPQGTPAYCYLIDTSILQNIFNIKIITKIWQTRHKTGTEFLSHRGGLHHSVSSSSALGSKQSENDDAFSACISLTADKPYICSHTCIQTGN